MSQETQSNLDPTSDFESKSLPSNVAEPEPAKGLGLLEEDLVERKWAGVQWIIGAGLIVAIALGGGFTYYRWFRPEPVSISVALVPVQRGDVRILVTAAGTVELGGQRTLTAPEDATVQQLLVEERQRVSQGEILLALRARGVQGELNDALVDAQIAENNVRRDRERIQERQAQLNRAQERFQESQGLLDRGFISEDEYLRDQESVETAQSNLRDVEVELANSELELRNRRLQIQNLQTQLADTQIVAPFDAIILRLYVNPGNGVQQGGDLLVLGDPLQEMVRLQLSDVDAQKVRVGLPARISVMGPNSQTFEGRVIRIAPQAQTSDEGRQEQTTVEAEVRLDEPSETLIPGSLVSVDVIVEESLDALNVPTTALQMEDGEPFVWVRDSNGTAQKRPVAVGLQSVESVEIVAGLETGDEVVATLPPDQPLTPGMPLTSPTAPDDVAPPPEG
ncbi:MAG: efflux RND transporter periplasmic adaptor subunit [Cyanobacteria bacterium J06638_22]